MDKYSNFSQCVKKFVTGYKERKMILICLIIIKQTIQKFCKSGNGNRTFISIYVHEIKVPFPYLYPL